MGLIMTALCAGISPMRVPSVTIIKRAAIINEMGTVGLVYGKSSRFCVKALIVARTNEPRIIPRIPATKVKKTDSKMI